MLNGNFNREYDIADEINQPNQTKGVPAHNDFDSMTSPVQDLLHELGILPFLLLTSVLMVVTFLIIMATPLRHHFGNSFGFLIGAAGLTILILFVFGWLVELKNKYGFSLPGIFVQTAGVIIGIVFLFALGMKTGWIGVIVGVLLFVITGVTLKTLNLNPHKGNTPYQVQPQNPEIAPGIALIRNIIKQLNTQAEDPSTNPYKRMFLTTKRLSEEMKDAAELQKQRVRYTFYVSEQIKLMAPKSLGYLLDMKTIFPDVYKELFGKEFENIDDTYFDGMYDEFNQFRDDG